MLRSLAVRNFAIIEELQLELSEGLNVFTGQTGAGKSIVIEALGFLLGGRGSLEWLRAGAQRLEVTGVFDWTDFPKELQSRFHLKELRVSVRRELDSSGKTRAYLHNQSVPVSVLAGWGDGLVDFHGQHEHQTLLKADVQLELLDGFGGLFDSPSSKAASPPERAGGEPAGSAKEPLRAELERAYKKWSQLSQELKSLELSDEERLKRVDLYRYQLSEITQADPKPGEEEELETLLPRLKNSERLSALSQQIHGILYEQEGSAQELLLKAGRSLEDLARLDPTWTADIASLNQAQACVRDISARLSGYQNQTELWPEKIDEIHSRLERLSRLKKKYGPALTDILSHRDRIQVELAWLENSQARVEEVEKRRAELEEALARLCAQAHQARMAAATRLSTRITKELKELGMEAARFSVSVEMEEGRYGSCGSDRVEFLIAPNPGELPKALQAIASGGELSRTMLALKTVLARNDRVRILVFDEVDSGVSGEIGRAVGRRLSELSKSRQVLCVTHLPQVACFAPQHFHVSKEVSGGRTYVQVRGLEKEARVEVLARMLGGRETTVVSRKHALELLEERR
ncbi:MAG: DNA repair protein RecN [Elusimicrobia bacterium]|nr:DNA repair protein RecN [Elusimicrobiota bacterium]